MQSFVVVTHDFAFGTSQAFRDYLIKKRKKLLYIEHPLFDTPFAWGLGSIDTLWKVIKSPKTFDVYIGSNRLNAFCGIVLKKVGKVKKVIYFSPDWVENRFNSSILNFIYDRLDYLCVKHSDVVWNSSAIMKVDPMMQKRLEKNYPAAWLAKQKQLPDGCNVYPYTPLKSVERYKIGFVSHLRKGVGGNLLIDAFKIVLKKLPAAKLLIIGSGPLEKQLRKKGLNLPIEFTGYVGDIKKVYEQLSSCTISVAPYRSYPDNISYYTDPGKVKVYLGLSLPVVITSVPKISKEIEQKNAGIVVTDTPAAFAGAIVQLLKDSRVLESYRKSAHRLAKKYSWDNIFDRALKKL